MDGCHAKLFDLLWRIASRPTGMKKGDLKSWLQTDGTKARRNNSIKQKQMISALNFLNGTLMKGKCLEP